MPREEQFRVVPADGFQRVTLVTEEFQREPRVQLRVVQSTLFELRVLIVLDEVVIWIPGKGEGIQLQRIHCGQPEKPKARFRGGQMRQVEGNQVMAEQEVDTIDEVVEFPQCRCSVSAANDQRLIPVGANGGECADTAVLPVDLEVDRCNSMGYS